MIFFLLADSPFDVLVWHALVGGTLALALFSKFVRRRENRLTRERVADEVWVRMVNGWVQEETDPLHSLQDLTPYLGEVLTPVEDPLGIWFPEQHEPADAHLFDTLTASWPSPVNVSWRPAWASPTGAWETVTPRQLAVSSS